MKPVKQREIVVELEKVQLVRKRARTVLMFCRSCWRESDFVSLPDAARIFEIADFQLTAFVRNGQAHLEEHSKRKFICTTAIIGHLNVAAGKTRLPAEE